MELLEASLVTLAKGVEARYAALGSMKEKAPDLHERVAALRKVARDANEHEQCREAVRSIVNKVKQAERELDRSQTVTMRGTVAGVFGRGKNNPRLILRKLIHLDSTLTNLEIHLSLRLLLLVTSKVVTRTETGETVCIDMDAKRKKQVLLQLLALQDPCMVAAGKVGAFERGSRGWLFSAIQKWFEKRTGKCLVLTGDPGVGKSMISTVLFLNGSGSGSLQLLEELGPTKQWPRIGALHYFQWNSSQTLKMSHCLVSVALQLALQIPGFYTEEIPTTKVELKELLNREPLELFNMLIARPALAVDRSQESIVVVLDGVDECPESVQDTVCKILYVWSDNEVVPKWLKVMVTSRFGKVNDYCALNDLRYTLVSIVALSSENKQDLLRQVSKKLEVYVRAKELEDACKQLMEASYSRPLYFKFLQRFLDNELDKAAECGCDFVSLDRIKEYNPESLETFYDDHLGRMDGESKLQVLHLLAPLLAARCPLPVALWLEVSSAQQPIDSHPVWLYVARNDLDHTVGISHETVSAWATSVIPEANVKEAHRGLAVWYTRNKSDLFSRWHGYLL